MATECALCGQDPALPMPGPEFHPECGVRSALGGIGHILDHPYWCRERKDPDMGLSYRESALRVWQWMQENWVGELTND